MIDSQLTTYAKQLIHDLKFSENEFTEDQSSYTFNFGNQLLVSVSGLMPGFFFKASIGVLPEQKREEFLTYVMQANLFGQGTGENVIGLDNEGKVLTLSLILPYQMPYPQFKEYMEEFVNYVDFWQKKREDACIAS